MKHILTTIALLWSFLPAGLSQMVGSNVFLKSDNMEVGILNNGSFGVCSGVPAGFHPRSVTGGGGTNLGIVYDWGHDGWTVGTPPYMGDYTAVGDPYEGWAIQIGSGIAQAFQACSTAGYASSGGLTLSGGNVGHAITPTGVAGYWSGMAGSVRIDMETSIQNGGEAILMKVKLRNTGTSTTPPIFYLRTCDPDVDQTWPTGGFNTTNTIVYQNDTLHRALVTAIGMSTYDSAARSFGLGTKDARARVFSYAMWRLSSAVSLNTVWNGTWSSSSGVGYAPGYSINTDHSIGIVFNLGSLVPGDSTTFTYSYLFNVPGGLDAIFGTPCTGTPVSGIVTVNTNVACGTTPISMGITGYSSVSGLSYQWQSSVDSVVWNNVPGAVASGYTFTGITTTTWYRCVVTCIASAASATSNVKKINFSTVCPCLHTAGTCNPNTASACTTTSIILNSIGYTASTGVALQWQSSSDSVTWTDITGANTVPNTFTGLGTTTFYRLRARCIATGVDELSNARKITYTVLCTCTGTPVTGTTTASTTYCSACALTLNLPAIPSLSGFTYQWEYSNDGFSGWTSIAGATTVPYTFTPTDANYYRCKVTCTNSGLTTASPNVFVGYAYRLEADSVYHAGDTVCNTVRVFARANGASTLLRLKTYYGDGTKDSIPLVNAGSYSYRNTFHTYNTPGEYTVRRVLSYNNTPVDSVTRTYTHIQCKTIPVKLFMDWDEDCIKNVTESFNTVAVRVRIDSNGTPVDTISATAGLFYRAIGPVGTLYEFRILPGGRDVVCPASGVHSVTISATGTYLPQWFGLICGSSTMADLAINSVVPVTGMRDQWGHIYVRNNYCLPSSATIKLRYSFKYSSYPTWRDTPSAFVAPTITWNIPAITAGSPITNRYYAAWASFSSLLTPGDTVVEEMIVIPSGDDIDTSNNHIIRVDTVRASCDPNMIEVSPAACFDTTQRFRFTVHFENTGNDTAYNVYVLDTLSPWLDPHSMEIVMSSAQEMNVFHYTEAGYNIVKFDFPNIKLLDSSWKGLNDGAFIYDIKRRADMPTGASILSRVGIYFDYNEVVMTNTVQNLKGCPLPPVQIAEIHGRDVNIYPNPATNTITVQTNAASFATYTITNAVGQQVQTGSISGNETVVHINELPAGVYNISLNGAAGREVKKFVKW